MFGRNKRSALDQARENTAQMAATATKRGRKGADKAGEAVKNFDAGKTAETAASVLADLKNKAADTLDKSGVADAVGTAASKAASAVQTADLGSKAAVAGERTASTA